MKPNVAQGLCDMHYRRQRKAERSAAGITCSIEHCEKPLKTRGWCDAHYARWREYGDPLYVPPAFARPCSIDGCEKPHEARGWCEMHYLRWKAHGDPLTLTQAERGEKERLIEEWIATRDRNENECWLDWPFPVSRAKHQGYPGYKRGKRQIKVGWLAMELTGRPRPEPPANHMLHSCDTPLCLNPLHLSWGPPDENNRQARERGRAVLSFPGTANPAARLTEADVLAIRANGEPSRVLAARYGVGRTAIKYIRSRKTWAHL